MIQYTRHHHHHHTLLKKFSIKKISWKMILTRTIAQRTLNFFSFSCLFSYTLLIKNAVYGIKSDFTNGPPWAIQKTLWTVLVHKVALTGQYKFTVYWTPPSAVLGSAWDAERAGRWSLHFVSLHLSRNDKNFVRTPIIQVWPPACPLLLNNWVIVLPLRDILSHLYFLSFVHLPRHLARGQATARMMGQSLIWRPWRLWLLFRDLLLVEIHCRWHQMVMTQCDKGPKIPGQKALQQRRPERAWNVGEDKVT